jgi:hypothetical protein
MKGGFKMARFLITIPHDAEETACARAVKFLLETGSHYLANADFGCLDGDHRAWIIVDDVDTKAEAMCIVPPIFRTAASIVQLNRFTLEWIDDFLQQDN